MSLAHLRVCDVLHRDLIARTMLVVQFDAHNWKKVLIKVTDYGLSLLVKKGGTVESRLFEIPTDSANTDGPTRWMAVEPIKHRSTLKKERCVGLEKEFFNYCAPNIKDIPLEKVGG